jgi:RimJ/RimL family protein N-acetyltransferase
VHIKHAEIEDLDGLTECAKRFFEYAGYAEQGTPLDPQSFKDLVQGYIESDNGIVLVLMDGDKVVGSIAGHVNEWGFNRNIKMAVELHYWVDEGYRGKNSVKMLILYEKYAQALGASKSMMVSIDTHLKDKVGNLYKRMGYREYEKFYSKDIGV